MKIIHIILSVLVPGSGHFLHRKIKEGVIILLSEIVFISLILWRIRVVLDFANLPTSFEEMSFFQEYQAMLTRNPGFLLLVTTGIIAVWALSVFDSVRLFKKKKCLMSTFTLILIVFFVFGAQISEVNIKRMFTDFSNTKNIFRRIFNPAKAVAEYTYIEKGGQLKVLVDDDKNPPALPDEIEGEPYLSADRTWGALSYQNDRGDTIWGDKIVLKGKGYAPGEYVRIIWIDQLGDDFYALNNSKPIRFIPDENGEFEIEIVLPFPNNDLTEGEQNYFTVKAVQEYKVEGSLHLTTAFFLIIRLLIETVFMGMIATFFGILLAIPFSFLGARNLMSGTVFSKILYYIARLIMNLVRSIEPLIWALIGTVWVGMGPFAGVIALTIHSIAALGKLYSESIENIDSGQIEAIQATGANKLQMIMYGVVPQMIPPFVSFTIYRWDINVRMSTIIGMVGGGGIGYVLIQYIQQREFEAAGFAMLLIALVVSILDYVSSRIRKRYI